MSDVNPYASPFSSDYVQPLVTAVAVPPVVRRISGLTGWRALITMDQLK
jgi:hypothetical protein